MNWTEAKSIILKNEEVKNELKMNEAEYRIIEEIIMAPMLHSDIKLRFS
jgi:hypothetical protein